MAALLAIIGSAFVGILDDIIDIRQRAKAILPFLFSIPLGTVIRDTTLWFPYIGTVNFGIFIILIIPLGVTCASNTLNMLEGFNGLGTGLSIIISSTLIIIAMITGDTSSLFLLVPLLGTLISFLWFNKYPAKIFPGDTLTLFAGATIGCAAIIGNMKTLGAILFIPMIIEFFLKLRSKFKAENFGIPDNHGYLNHKGKIYSLSHIVMKKLKLKEWQLVMFFWMVELAICTVVVVYVMLQL
jgi:UDP-N-acetylglucosamine--dolichyl-phosphate N-acetylglucosaminephosphotransferase